MEEFQVISEFGDACCGVSFDVSDEVVDVNFHFNSICASEMNWNMFPSLVAYVDLWKDELHYVAQRATGNNWAIMLKDYDGDGKGILFECYGNKGETIDLGTLAECYEDCDTCTKCHNHYVDFCRYCEGCSEHPCTKYNGRADLETALKVKDILL